MKVEKTPLNGCLVIEPKVFGDQRGFFFESFNQKVFNELTQTNYEFVQDNHSMSSRGVLRGIHYQIKQAQGKLVRVVRGEVFDVVVDLRKSSPTFGQWYGVVLSESNRLQMWIPPGFGHGFVVLSEKTEFLYKTTDFYAPEHERCILWNDPALGIDWHFDGQPHLSEKDKSGRLLKDAEVFE